MEKTSVCAECTKKKARVGVKALGSSSRRHIRYAFIMIGDLNSAHFLQTGPHGPGEANCGGGRGSGDDGWSSWRRCFDLKGFWMLEGLVWSLVVCLGFERVLDVGKVLYFGRISDVRRVMDVGRVLDVGRISDV